MELRATDKNEKIWCSCVWSGKYSCLLPIYTDNRIVTHWEEGIRRDYEGFLKSLLRHEFELERSRETEEVDGQARGYDTAHLVAGGLAKVENHLRTSTLATDSELRPTTHKLAKLQRRPGITSSEPKYQSAAPSTHRGVIVLAIERKLSRELHISLEFVQ